MIEFKSTVNNIDYNGLEVLVEENWKFIKYLTDIDPNN